MSSAPRLGVIARIALAEVVQPRAEQQQVGPATRWRNAAASTAASIRCRSTVKRWYGLCCGLLRTGSHSGSTRRTGRTGRAPRTRRRSAVLPPADRTSAARASGLHEVPGPAASCAQPVEGGRRDRRIGRRRSGPDAQDERAVGHVGVTVDGRLTLAHDHAHARRHDRASRCGCCACPATRRCAATRRRSSTRSCGPRPTNPLHQRVRRSGDRVPRATPSCSCRTSCSPRPF